MCNFSFCCSWLYCLCVRCSSVIYCCVFVLFLCFCIVFVLCLCVMCFTCLLYCCTTATGLKPNCSLTHTHTYIYIYIILILRGARETNEIQSQSYLTLNGQSASLSSYQATIWGLDQIFLLMEIFFRQLRSYGVSCPARGWVRNL
jgi:hypothetical protein